MKVKKQVFADVEAVVSPDVRAGDQHLVAVDHRDGRRPRAPGAGRRLPLLQPGRGDAAARDRPGRADRRRHAGHRVRDRQGAEEDQHPGQGQPVVHREPAARPVHGRGRPDRRRGHPARPSPTARSPGSPRCRRSSCSRWSGRPSRCTTARRCTAPSRTGSTSPRTWRSSSRRARPACYAPDFSVDPEVAEIFAVPGGRDRAGPGRRTHPDAGGTGRRGAPDARRGRRRGARGPGPGDDHRRRASRSGTAG